MKSPGAPQQEEFEPLAGDAALAAAAGGGLTSPRLVTRGESSQKKSQTAHPRAAFTDFLTVTFPFPPGPSRLSLFFERLALNLGGALGEAINRGRGLHGFHESFAFEKGGALFAFGGQNGRAMLSLPGEACALVPSWSELTAHLCDELSARITRWDGARDELDGRYAVNDAVRWYLAGGFNCGGNRPACSQQGNWLTPDVKGRTFYVGNRKNGKLCRIYEKGKQLGDPSSPWARFEVELHNTDRFIPFGVLLEPGRYVAGAYPCLAWISEATSRIPTIDKQQLTAYEAMVGHARIAFGQLIDTMEYVEGSAQAAIDRLKRPGLPKRLDVPSVPPSEGFPS